MNFAKEYEAKRISVEQALRLIESNDTIAVASSVMEPAAVLSQLHTAAQRGVKNVRVYMAVSFSQHEFIGNPEYKENFLVDSSFYSSYVRARHMDKCVTFNPTNMHHTSQRRIKNHRPRIFYGSASKMDEHGYMRISLSLMTEPPMIEAADIIVLEVNPNLPITNGDTEIHISDVDYVIDVDRPVQTIVNTQPDGVDLAIGRNVAKLVHDGDTIQLGIGNIPNAVTRALMDKKDLGVHTEMLTSGVVDLVECGAVTNKKKTLHRGKIVACFVAGTDRLYRFVNNNPSVLVKRGDYVTDPRVISQNDNMVSINTALQVDLTGQVCSESIGSMHYSGTGGQSDTAEGAINAKNGRSIIAIRSTAKGKGVSKIQANLTPGAIVSLTRNNIDYIVTEYGIAALVGRNVRERVENLITVAHPDFREALRKAAEENCLW